MDVLGIIVAALFADNFILVKFLGICPFLGVSKKTSSALGMGLAVTAVMVITCVVTYPIYTFILLPLGLQYLEILVFILVIAALVQMLEMILKKFTPTLYSALGIYLPLVTTNCAILGIAETVIALCLKTCCSASLWKSTWQIPTAKRCFPVCFTDWASPLQ